MELLTEREHYFRETREQIRLKIKGRKGECIVLHDFEKNRETAIHHSVIRDNDFEVNDGMLSVSKETYKCWFHNLSISIIDEINERRAKRAKIIYENIILLLKYKNEILGSPGFRNILASDTFYISPIGMPENKVITLGELLQIWDLEPAFSTECACGGKAYVFRFGGSIYTGSLDKYFWCPNCGKVFADNKIKESFKELAQIRGKYTCTESIVYSLNALLSMIRKFKKREILAESGEAVESDHSANPPC